MSDLIDEGCPCGAKYVDIGGGVYKCEEGIKDPDRVWEKLDVLAGYGVTGKCAEVRYARFEPLDIKGLK